MSLVEAEDPTKLDGNETPVVTPPRPPHRRVSVSLIFTLTVLIGTVVTIYLVFPKRDDVLVTEGLERHREASPKWELAAPSPAELRAYVLGVVGPDAPEQPPPDHVIGALRTVINDRPAAVARIEKSGETLTVLVQHALGIAPSHTRTEGAFRAITVRHGVYATIVVGPAATADRWSSAFR